jgi:hypothetical protein
LKKEYRPEDWQHGIEDFTASAPWNAKEPAKEDEPPKDNNDRHGSIALYGPAIVISHSHPDHFAIQQKYKDLLVVAPADESALVPPVLMRRPGF